ncbi:MAG TPA: sigma-70 family RNA polymerase sigma factor [Mycobacteriales bacterium]|nr:sigma-70 family RNA polymerase sigma factor [Mycobacteriales bacterium]
MAPALDEDLLREASRQVLGALVRRAADFAAAEDAVQEALLEATLKWPESGVPAEPVAWLTTVARRKLVDVQRSDASRRQREANAALEPEPGPTERSDDTLLLLFLCCHPALSPTLAVPLTLRAVGGLTTREIAEAYLLPEATIAQRISRAKKTIGQQDLSAFRAALAAGEPDKPVVLRVLYLIFNEGYTTGDRIDLAAEAIRLTRLLYAASPDPEVAGLLSLMLLHHARRFARFDNGNLVPLDEQDRTRWDRALIAEGVGVLQAALAEGRHGEYQVQAAIAALHDDARSADETDWTQILAWYDELVALTNNPLAELSRAVAVGEVDGPLAGLRALDGVEERLTDYHRLYAVRAHLHERAGNTNAASDLFAKAAASATSTAERNHLLRRAAQARAATTER